MNKRYNPEIQALRAFAVLIVIVHHTAGLFFWDPAKWSDIGQGMWVGVDLFFCISGYVIAKSLLPRLEGKSGVPFWKEVGAFWLRRLYRISPTVWLWMLIVMAAGPLFSFLGTKGFSSQNLGEAVAVMLHVANFHVFTCTQKQNACGDFGIFWTLSLEEQFYLALPIVAFLFRKRLTLFLIALVVAQIWLDRSAWSSVLTLVRTDAIALGVLLAIFSRSDVYRAIEPKLTASRLRFIIPPALLFALVATTRFQIVTFDTGMAAIVSAVILWISSYDKGYFFRASIFRTVLAWIGERSFAMYVIHIYAYWFTRVIWERIEPAGTQFNGTYTIRFALTALVLIFVLADLNFRFVEEPLRRRGQKKAEDLLSAGEDSSGKRSDVKGPVAGEPTEAIPTGQEADSTPSEPTGQHRAAVRPASR
ncbi:acyltransferase [Paraburkholderia nemoris]|uniref:acyltransferase family protein n=1 Tax=Paraburkholderia nemoris TaxID=2793076 RepID=UPI0019099F91|nr:acyltransferase [Paraburkholderia nemoris]MBK3742972.1 acyltransferase [Paraburkholderia aspalathi]CAE6800729.1 O-acetyltransferase OatA [Paraburkholderia nemoris]